MVGRFYDASWIIPDEEAESLWERRYPEQAKRKEEMKQVAYDEVFQSNQRKDGG